MEVQLAFYQCGRQQGKSRVKHDRWIRRRVFPAFVIYDDELRDRSVWIARCHKFTGFTVDRIAIITIEVIFDVEVEINVIINYYLEILTICGNGRIARKGGRDGEISLAILTFADLDTDIRLILYGGIIRGGVVSRVSHDLIYREY